MSRVLIHQLPEDSLEQCPLHDEWDEQMNECERKLFRGDQWERW
jgi:hypothetical protein